MVQASSDRPLCGKLQGVTLVLMKPYAERILSLLRYADWFGAVLFFLQDEASVSVRPLLERHRQCERTAKRSV